MPQQNDDALRPPLTLVPGPAGSGKTEWAIARFLESDRRALLLVSSPDQAETRAAQIAERAGKSVAETRGAVMAFRSFVGEIGRMRPDDSARLIGRAFQRLALADLLPRTLRPDDFFGRALATPGFVAALAERIREWKLAAVTPEALEAGAEAAAESLGDNGFARKAREMARLFRAYETLLLQNHLRDEEDLLRLAAETIASPAFPLPREANLLLVDGFYRFNRAQRLLLAAAAGRGVRLGKPEVEVAVTLSYEADRPLLFAAPERTLHILRAEFDTREIALPARADHLPPTLRALEASLFAPAAQTQEPSAPIALPQRPTPDAPPPSSETLTLFDAPNPYVEAEMVAREFRRLHDREGYAWSDCAILLRTLGHYAPILSAVFERYGIPLSVDGPEILAENPLLKTILHLFAVAREGWQREDVIAFLKSSYTAPDKLAVESLRRRARAAGARSGREGWLELAGEAEDAVSVTLREMARWEERLLQDCRAPLDYAEAVMEMLEAFGMEARIETGEPLRQKQDRAALNAAQDVLQDVLHMAELAGKGQVSLAQFHDVLREAWRNVTALAPLEGDVVRVSEPYDARERPLKVAAVMGLTERVFPRRITEDPFLRDEERAALRQAAGLDLEEQKARADDERFFFYLAVTAPTERLRLSFPRSNDESDTLPSFYLDEVRAVFSPTGDASVVPTISRTLADVAPRPDEIVSREDRLLAACAGLFDPGAESDEAERSRRLRAAARLMRECLEAESQDAGSDSSAQRALSVIESRRLPRLPALRDPELRAAFIGAKSVYSVTELETYRSCPLRYLLQHVLRLRPEEDGGNARAQGTLLHGTLRRYFRRRAAQKTEAPDAETMRTELSALLAETLAQATETANLDATPHRLRMMERMLADSLHGFAERETRFSAQFGMRPAHCELAFGTGAGTATLTADEERDEEDGPPPHDPASCPEPLRIEAKDGGSPVAVCGAIDRVDLDATGTRALVMDYKLTKSVEYAAMQRGDSLQMPLYLMAMERLFGKAGAVGCYDAMRERGRRRILRTEHVNLRQFSPLLPVEDGTMVKPLNRDEYARLIQTAETTVIEAARAIESGRIEATPGEHCASCAFSDVCRATVAGGHDGEPLSA